MSSRRSSRPELESPVFFLDRGLGRIYVPSMLVETGHDVRPMAEIYPGGLDQRVDDPTWISLASAEGWLALTKDAAIVRHHEEALRSSTLRVFALDNSNLTGPEMAERFRSHLGRIIQRARKPGPYLYVIHSERIELRWRP